MVNPARLVDDGRLESQIGELIWETGLGGAAMFFLSWFGFVPFTHMFTFAPGQGWVDFLPQFGYGTVGGWAVALVYTCILGSLIFLRWRSGAWRRIDLR